MNIELYQATKATLENLNVPSHLADAASQIIATDDSAKRDLGRTTDDIQVCKQVVEIINQGTSQVKSDRSYGAG